MLFFSANTLGFYDSYIHGDDIPADAVQITTDEHETLLSGQSGGLIISADDTGRPVLISPPPPSAEQIRAQLVSVVQAHLDSMAQSSGYDNIFTACTYADEPSVPRFQEEGKALRAWRSLVWAKCYDVLAAVEAGKRGVPSAEEILAELPAPKLP